MELTIDVIKRTDGGLIRNSCFYLLAANNACQAQITHQSLHGATGNIKAFSLHLRPHFAHPVDMKILFKHSFNLALEGDITLCPP